MVSREMFEIPVRVVMDMFGSAEPTLVYADLEGPCVVLHSNRPLEGYEERDGVYVKGMGSASPRRFLDRRANIYPIKYTHTSSSPDKSKFTFKVWYGGGPSKTDRETFGVSSSFGYVASDSLVQRCLVMGGVCQSWGQIPLFEIAPEIPLAHEGSHVAISQVFDEASAPFLGLVPDSYLLDASQGFIESEAYELWSKHEKSNPVNEAVCRLAELRAAQEFRGQYEKAFALSEGNEEGKYREAHRLLVEHGDELEALAKEIKRLNTGVKA